MQDGKYGALSAVEGYDEEIGAAMRRELERQRNNIELIASENIVSDAVLAAMGSILTNKYAEGYPGNRYYGGCEFVDEIETIAIERAKEVFGCSFANVQPHSGVQANLSAYTAILKPGDKVLSMDLSQGGHLSHGSPANVSGIVYNFARYGVGEDGYIDYSALEEKAMEFRPNLIVAGASSYPRVIDFERISGIAKRSGALFIADIAHIAGLVAAGEHPSPIGLADITTSTTHKTMRGPRGGMILSEAKFGRAIDKAVFPGNQGGPLMHIIAAKAVCLKEAMEPGFKSYQAQVVKNAKALANGLSSRGASLVSGGTDNHLMLMDLRPMKLTGNVFEKMLDSVHLTANKNLVPGDTEGPNTTSGLRLGTPSSTSRGFDEGEMDTIADLICMIAKDYEGSKAKVAEKVKQMCDSHPIY